MQNRVGPIAVALSIAAPLWLSACGMVAVVAPGPTPLSRAHFDKMEARRVDEFLPWAEDLREMIIVDKELRKLVLYRLGEPVKSYAVVLGRARGRKLFEGDRRTPSGFYRIIAKRSHPRWDRFLALNYPNDEDIEQYRTALAGSLTPAVLGSVSSRKPGGLIGIHGSDKEDFNRLGIDWTFGCISLTNRDVEDLYAEVEEGTPVLISDDQQP